MHISQASLVTGSVGAEDIKIAFAVVCVLAISFMVRFLLAISAEEKVSKQLTAYRADDFLRIKTSSRPRDFPLNLHAMNETSADKASRAGTRPSLFISEAALILQYDLADRAKEISGAKSWPKTNRSSHTSKPFGSRA